MRKQKLLIQILFIQFFFTSISLSQNKCADYFDDTVFTQSNVQQTELPTSVDIHTKDIPAHELPSELRTLKQQTPWNKLGYPAKVAWNWVHSTVHNFRGVFAVIDIMALRKLPAKLVPENHPWTTGISPQTGQKIWPENIVFSSPRNEKMKNEISDSDIVTKIGSFLASMTKRSTPETEIPQGPKRRMPHAVNYIHGTVHYNGLFMIFNNFKDAQFYFTDPTFVKEFKRVGVTEKREITIVFRDRDYQEYDYAFFMGFIRSTIPWYANGNGPKKKVFYGAMASYPSVNTINGSWVNDMYELKKNGLTNLVRPAVEKNKYFQMTYQGDRQRYSVAEKALAYLNYAIVKARGAQGGMVFTKRSIIEPDKVNDYNETGEIDAGVNWKIPDFYEEVIKKMNVPEIK